MSTSGVEKTGAMRLVLMALCASVCSGTVSVRAEDGGGEVRVRMSATCAPDAQVKAEVAAASQAVSVTDAGPLGTNNKIATGAAALDGSICVHVANLQQWIASGKDAGKLVLYLDGRALDDPKIGPEVHSEGSDLVYRLVRTDATKEQWKALLGNPCSPQCSGYRSFRVSVGPKEGPPLASSAPALRVQVISLRSPAVVLLILGGLGLVALIWSKRLRMYVKNLARESDTIRPPGPYSLGRCQMIFWLFLVLIAYLTIYGLTGYYDTLSASVLTLIGISGGTSLLGVVVDSSARDEARKSLKETEDKLNALPAPPPTPEDQKKKDALEKEKARLSSIVDPQSSGKFLKDILSYGSGGDTGVHRFQIVIWTLTLGAIFVIEVYRTLAMPDFAAGLLGLMGISSGTYIGFKVATQTTKQQ